MAMEDSTMAMEASIMAMEDTIMAMEAIIMATEALTMETMAMVDTIMVMAMEDTIMATEVGTVEVAMDSTLAGDLFSAAHGHSLVISFYILLLLRQQSRVRTSTSKCLC